MSKEYSLLLVEDENILYGMKNVLACTLNRLSEVLTAENGKEALDVIEMAHPDMIITDLRMPEMDGIALVKEIRARQYTMPIIVLTAIADFQAIKSLIPYGIQNYIFKAIQCRGYFERNSGSGSEAGRSRKSGAGKEADDGASGTAGSTGVSRKSELVFQAQTYARTSKERTTWLPGGISGAT